MITKEVLIEEIMSGRVDVDYFRPFEHVEVMCDDESGYGNMAYVIKDDDATDFGCMLVRLDEFPWASIRFDWYSGKWISDDEEMRTRLEDGCVIAALNAQFAGQIAGLSPIGGFGCVDSIEGWRKIISLCLNEDESRIRVFRDSDRQGEEYNFKYGPICSDWNNCECYSEGM